MGFRDPEFQGTTGPVTSLDAHFADTLGGQVRRKTMRHFSIFVMLLTCTGIAIAQPNVCTQDTVVGTYALASQGSVMLPLPGASQPAPVPVVGLALVSMDSKGAVTGSAYQSTGGQLIQFPMPGTMKINSDCTGSVDLGGGITGNLVVLGEGREINSIMTATAKGSPIISARWKRISRIPNTVEPNQCSPNSLVGVYAIRQTGTMMVTSPGSSQALPMPAAMQAMGSVGYDGNGPANGIASVGGQTIPFSVPNTKFVVKSDCTATTVFDLASQGVNMGPGGGWGIVLDGGNEVWSIETQDPTGAPVILGTWKRISPLPAAAQ